MPPTLNIDIQNKIRSNQVYAYISGQALDNGNRVCLIKADGQAPYYPDSPSPTPVPLCQRTVLFHLAPTVVPPLSLFLSLLAAASGSPSEEN
jgi:hypothetical protein